MPHFDGIGANEYIVDVTHDVVDFISAADTPFVWELNIWYHTLNADSARASAAKRISRASPTSASASAARTCTPARLTYDAWCEGIREGRSYVSDGFSHLMDFRGQRMRPAPAERAETRAARDRPGDGARRLPPARQAARRRRRPPPEPVWSPEHARVARIARVPVEVVVNGRPAATKLAADGTLATSRSRSPSSGAVGSRCASSGRRTPIRCSSLVGGRPIRASRRSAMVLKAVDQCWSQKSGASRAVRETARRGVGVRPRAISADPLGVRGGLSWWFRNREGCAVAPGVGSHERPITGPAIVEARGHDHTVCVVFESADAVVLRDEGRGLDERRGDDRAVGRIARETRWQPGGLDRDGGRERQELHVRQRQRRVHPLERRPIPG